MNDQTLSHEEMTAVEPTAPPDELAVFPVAEAGILPARSRANRLSGPSRRVQLLETAEAQFAATGLHGTTTAALAKAAGISEPILYLHFESKERLFDETIEHNVEKRLHALQAALEAVAAGNAVDCVRKMAEATIAICLSDEANAILTTWALLETPDHAVDLHRREVGSVCSAWERQLAERFPEARSQAALWEYFIHQAVHACLAFGFWLATLHHNVQSAGALARQFAFDVSQTVPDTAARNGSSR